MNGPELRALRESLGLTQVQLAQRLGIHERNLRKKETDKAGISQTDVLALRQIALELERKTEF